jgi:hypothetical protein
MAVSFNERRMATATVRKQMSQKAVTAISIEKCVAVRSDKEITSFCMTVFIQPPSVVRQAYAGIFNKMYISNVSARLRELNSPTENDMKRWVYELLQNAKDSIANDTSRDGVNVIITATDEWVEFKHNGSPFTADALFGLLYKYSDGKQSTESTGRFGTGFLTTHCLSKVVSIEGDLYANADLTDVCGFSVTMYRSGSSDAELLEGIKETEASLQYTRDCNKWTTFRYHLQSPENQKAKKIGLENLLTNAAPTMLFCPRIKTLDVTNHKDRMKFVRLDTRKIDARLSVTDFLIDGTNRPKRTFIHTSVESSSSELTERYKVARRMRFTLAVEVDHEHNVVEQGPLTPSHFCEFPLIGSEAHLMPILINSPDFEPDSERQNLILSGAARDFANNMITECGINQMILTATIKSFDVLVSFLSGAHHNLFYLLKGLRVVPTVNKWFDGEWFRGFVMTPYRKVLEKYPIVETVNGKQKLFEGKEPYILFIEENNEEDKEEGALYDLYRDCFDPARLVVKQLNKQWTARVWPGCGLRGLRHLCKVVDDLKTMENLRLGRVSRFGPYEWLNKLYRYVIAKEHITLLREFKIIPNQKNEFGSDFRFIPMRTATATNDANLGDSRLFFSQGSERY